MAADIIFESNEMRTDCDWNMVLVLMLTDPVETDEKPYLLR